VAGVRGHWHRSVSLWAPPALYALAIFVSSSLTAVPAPPPHFTDKHVHLLAFGGFALVLVRALSGGRWSGITVSTTLQAATIAVVYGVTDEWHQAFVPGRHADVADVLADAVGAVLAVAVVGAIARRGRAAGRVDSTIERAGERAGQTP
jgi:VanZ family protein